MNEEGGSGCTSWLWMFVLGVFVALYFTTYLAPTLDLMSAEGGDVVTLPADSVPCWLLEAQPGKNQVSGPGVIHVDCK